ncbi:MAG: hypothetical protein AB7I36_08480 [Rhodospirillaceae bacterium]
MGVRALDGTVFRRVCPQTNQLRVVVKRRENSLLDAIANNFDLSIPYEGLLMFEGKLRKVVGCRRIAERLFHVVFEAPKSRRVAA